jgi:DNA-binding helix-turn-helix protein
MDVLKRIEELRIQKGWTMYKLSNEADLTPSTLANMYARGTSPSIATLTNICRALGISLSDFFKEDSEETDKNTLVQKFDKLNDEQQKAVITIIDGMQK